MDEHEGDILVIGLFLVAVVVLIGLALWLVPQYDRDYESRVQDLAYEEGRLDSYIGGLSEGREQGIAETQALAEAEVLVGKSQAYQDGWRAGYEAGVYGHYQFRTF